MNFRSEQDIKRLRSLKYVLEMKMHDTHRAIIVKKLKTIFTYFPVIDKQPVDAYRIIGLMTVKIQLIEEVNKLIAEYTTSYMMVIPWVRELYELWMHCHQMKELATTMTLALLSRGISSGFYNPEELDKLQNWKFVEI